MVDKVQNIAYGSQLHQKYDRYLPDSGSWDRAIIHFHGGSWQYGDKHGPHEQQAGPYYADTMGIGWFSGEYKLGTTSWDQNIYDVQSCISFIQGQHPGKLWFLCGHSAGAHLISLAVAWRGVSNIAGVMPLDSPSFNFHNSGVGVHQHIDPVFPPDQWTRASPNTHLDGGTYPRGLIVCSNEWWSATKQRPDSDIYQNAMTNGITVVAPNSDHIQVIWDYSTPGTEVANAVAEVIRDTETQPPPPTQDPGTVFDLAVRSDGSMRLSDPDGTGGGTEPPPALTPVSNLRVSSNGSSEQTIAWDYSGGGITGFDVERQVSGRDANYVPVADLGSGSRSYRSSGLPSNTLVKHRVRAKN